MAQDKKNEEQNGGENVDKIRDILFGEEMRVYERRFNELDQRLVREQQKLKDELGSRLTKFEGFMKKEIEKLTEKDKQEKKDRVDAVKMLKDNLQEVIKELNTVRLMKSMKRFPKNAQSCVKSYMIYLRKRIPILMLWELVCRMHLILKVVICIKSKRAEKSLLIFLPNLHCV